MRKLIFGFILIGALLSFNNTDSFIPVETNVYICNSTGSTKYHYKKDCRGLNACKHEIIKVSLSDAKKRGKKTLCGWED